jgi:hypothetical protein
MSSRATKGNVTKEVASTRPGVAKMIFKLWFSGHTCSACCTPNRTAKSSTAAIGTTSKGRCQNPWRARPSLGRRRK